MHCNWNRFLPEKLFFSCFGALVHQKTRNNNLFRYLEQKQPFLVIMLAFEEQDCRSLNYLVGVALEQICPSCHSHNGEGCLPDWNRNEKYI